MYADLDLFLRAVQAVATLYEDGFIRVLIQPSGHALFVQFELLSESPGYEEALASVGITAEDLEAVSPDVADVIGGLLANYPAEAFGRLRATRRPDQEDEEVAVQKYEATDQVFDLRELRRRTWLKENTTVPVAAGVNWEVATKHCDDSGDDGPGQVPYAILKLVTDVVDPQGWPQLGRSNTLMLLDVADVEFVLDSLTRLRDALRDAEEGMTRS